MPAIKAFNGAAFSKRGDFYSVSGNRVAIAVREYSNASNFPAPPGIPHPMILSASQRVGANLVEVDYQVKDADSATVTSALLAVRDGNSSNRTGYSAPITNSQLCDLWLWYLGTGLVNQTYASTANGWLGTIWGKSGVFAGIKLSEDLNNPGDLRAIPTPAGLVYDYEQMGAHPITPAEMSRAQAAIYVDFTGQLPLRLASDPATILDQLDYYPTGSRITLPSKEGHASGGYQFTWWDLNGTRQQDASGAALPGFSFTLDTPSTATAHYIDPNIDTDGDGIKDWNEWTYFGSLIHDAGSDPDDDGFTYATELARGQGPQVTDLLSHGSVSRRRSSPVFMSGIGHLSFRTTSDPATILNDQQFLLPGGLDTVADKTGHTYSTFMFTWWDRNGIRQEDPSGIALGGFKFMIDTPTQLVGHYIDPTIDTDGDGIKDSRSNYQQWALIYSIADPYGDEDGDGVVNLMEYAFGMNPRTASDLWKMPEIELIGGRFRLSVTAPQDVTDVIYGAEWSRNMEVWTAISDSGGGACHEFWTPGALVGEARVFVRWAIRPAP